tara:strand:- start:74 stop:652 length:579 start_codon:yes stop_codon:yes gene_type:complete
MPGSKIVAALTRTYYKLTSVYSNSVLTNAWSSLSKRIGTAFQKSEALRTGNKQKNFFATSKTKQLIYSTINEKNALQSSRTVEDIEKIEQGLEKTHSSTSFKLLQELQSVLWARPLTTISIFMLAVIATNTAIAVRQGIFEFYSIETILRIILVVAFGFGLQSKASTQTVLQTSNAKRFFAPVVVHLRKINF